MPQADVTLRSNTTRVLDCLEWLFKQINPANNTADRTYYTQGVAINRRRDARVLIQDLQAEYKKLGSIIMIKKGAAERVPGTSSAKGPLGNAQRFKQGVDLVCRSMMTDDQDRAGVYLDQLVEWLQHDIKISISNDNDGTDCITRAARGLQTVDGPWGTAGLWGSRPSCINLQITKIVEGPLSSFPELMHAIQLEYLFDEFGPNRLPASM